MKYTKMVLEMTDAELEELHVALMVRAGWNLLHQMFPVDTLVKPRGDHTKHEWHIVQFELDEDYKTAWATVFDPRANVTAKFNVEDFFPDGLARDNYWRVNSTASKN